MANEDQKYTFSEELPETITVTRINEETKEEVSIVLPRTIGQKSKDPYYNISDKTSQEEVERFFGKKWVFDNITTPKLNLFLQNLWKVASLEQSDVDTHMIDTPKTIKSAQIFIAQRSKRGESIRDLQAKIMDLVTKMTLPENKDIIFDILGEIREIRETVERKQRNNEVDTEE